MTCSVSTPILEASAISRLTTPRMSEASTPASAWSDGDRERLPTHGLLASAIATFAQLAVVGDAALGRLSKSHIEIVIGDALSALLDAGLLPAHVLVCAVSIGQRVSAAMPKAVSSFTVKRVAVAAAVLAAKAESDEQCSLACYATATGISVETIKGTEMQIFERLDFNVGTSTNDFQSALDRMCDLQLEFA